MSSLRRTGVAAVLAGALIFAGQAGELVFGSPSDLVDALFVALWASQPIPSRSRSNQCGSELTTV